MLCAWHVLFGHSCCCLFWDSPVLGRLLWADTRRTSGTLLGLHAPGLQEPSLVSMYLYPGIVSAGHTYVDWRKKFEEYAKGYADPISDKLLPDLGPNLSHVRTLVLDLDGTLVHSDWKRERGWRTFKRPGVDAFLQNMSNYYEIVVFTDQLSSYGEPVLDRLDPQRYYIPYRLYRDATHYKDGEHFRDLTKLNRDLAKVVFISANPKAFALQPENAIRIIPYEMDPKDTALLDLMPFLESAVRQGVPDMRQLLASYKGQNIPEAYRERVKDMQRKMQERGERSFLRRLSGQGPSPPPAQHM
eukprot:jgi/Mesvir1/20809/Mv07911-RA.1